MMTCLSQISTVAMTPTGLEVAFSNDAKPAQFSWFWLRDHGIDENSLDPDTLQRRVNTFAIPRNIEPTAVNFDKDTQLVEIEWADAPTTTVSAQLLAGVETRAPESHELAPGHERVLWDKDAPLPELPKVHYDDVMTDDGTLREWLENIVVYGFSLVEGVPSTEEATRALAERIGLIQETIFGGVWMLSAEMADHGDTAYSTQFLEPHTDATYSHDAPGLQMFNCLEFDGKGGECVQLDGFAIAERIRQDDPDAYKTLTEIIIPGHYLEPGVHLRAERPPFRLNARGELVQISFNNYDRAPMHLSDEDTERFYHAYSLFHRHAMNQDNWLKIRLRPGMFLIFDNWRNLHGRMGYVGKRVFSGCYQSHWTLESKLRVLQTKGITATT
ncbi:MAG: trimethyllysine dioxygenase [Gammaproteobacteria bacterium]|jgi:trimethyllysine dioxygenase